jgi:CheY-like chemotaxis protein
MKTYYRIIWIDDDMDTTTIDRDDVVDYLEDRGIRADITPVQAPADGSVHEQLNHLIYDPDLDILMVDYNMDGLQGDKLVDLIRNSDHVYLPIIFYSSSPVDELFEAVKNSQLDGVYIANREQLLPKFKSVVESLLVKEHTIKRTRGLLMEGVSEIDARFKGILDQAWKHLNDDDKKKLKKHLGDIVAGRVKSAERVAKKFPRNLAEFEEHIAEKFMTKSYDTYTRWRFISKVLELLKHDEEVQKTLKEFGESNDESPPLNGLRNIYAHQTRAQLGETHSTENCIKVRKDLRRHQSNIDMIEGSIPG